MTSYKARSFHTISYLAESPFSLRHISTMRHGSGGGKGKVQCEDEDLELCQFKLMLPLDGYENLA